MILIDYSQIAISNIMISLGKAEKHLKEDNTGPLPVDAHLIRHMVLNSIRDIVRRHKGKYGSNIVIACDDREYWRKTIFPYYKANRKKSRESSPWDWSIIFENMNMVKQELIEYFPYKVMQITGCEADDIIGTLCHANGTIGEEFGGLAVGERILIVSGDKDFAQLQIFDNVEQYSPQSNKMIIEKEPITHLKRHIMKGDSGDGVPNFLSPDDTFVTGARQKSLLDRDIKTWVGLPPINFCINPVLEANWNRNETLVDLSKVPTEFQQQILTTYSEYKTQPKSKMFNYFIKFKLKELHSAINDF